MNTAFQVTADMEHEQKPPLAPTPEWLAMSKEERAAWLREHGKGYLSKEEQEERLRLYHGDIEMVYLAEGSKASKAGDEDTFWQWYSLMALPGPTLMTLKWWYGANFIRATGFDTSNADEDYGPGWLDK